MFICHLKIIFRKFIRNPLYPIISIICLSLVFTCVFFVTYWIKSELSYNKFHNNYDRIYRLTIEVNDIEKG